MSSPSHINGQFEEEGSMMTEERLTMLKLRFDESDFGVPLNNLSGGATSFSAPSFVRSKAEYFSYEELEEDLQLYSEHLERRILRHIHDDVHEAFIAVAAHMEGVRGPLAGVLAPSHSVERRLEGCVSEIQTVKEDVMQHLQAATAHASEEDACNAEIRCLVLYQRACAILAQMDEVRGATVRHIQLLDELCVVVRGFRGSAAIACTGSDRNSDEIKGLFASAEGALRTCLSDTLSRQLQQFGDAARSSTLTELQPLLDLFVEYGEIPTLITALKDSVLRPRLEASLSWSAVHEARKNPATTSSLFDKLVEQLTAFVAPLVGVLQLWVDQSGVGVEQPLYPVLDVVWPAVSEIIQKRFSGLLNPAMPEVFQASFIACEGVVGMLNTMCTSSSERAAFQQQTQSTEDGAVGRWAATWQRHLSVYKSVIHNDAVTSIKKCMPSTTVTSAKGTPYFYQATFSGIVNSMEHLLSPSVFVGQIGADLLKEASLAAMRGVEGIVNTLAPEQCTIVIKSADGAVLSRTHRLVALADDLSKLQLYVNGPFAELAGSALHVHNDASLDAVLSTVSKVISKAVHFLVGECAGDLVTSSASTFAVGSQQMVSRIGSNLAFTSPDHPLATSGYVATITDQISEFLSGTKKYCSDSTSAHIVATAVGCSLAQTMQRTASECIRTAARRQEVLARRKKKSDDEPVSMDDVDKIIVQLYADLCAIRDHSNVLPHLSPTDDYTAMMGALGSRAAWVCCNKMPPSVYAVSTLMLPEAPAVCPVLWGVE